MTGQPVEGVVAPEENLRPIRHVIVAERPRGHRLEHR